MMDLFGSVEVGGTKIGCLIGSGPDKILKQSTFATTKPDVNIVQVLGFFNSTIEQGHRIKAIGMACFGPLNLDKASAQYGMITTTPKPHWRNINLMRMVSDGLGLPVAIETDVTGAALGEMAWGNGAGLTDLVYFTIGTGIGGGAIVNGKPVHGLVHPEMGHMLIPHDRNDDPFDGICPFHGDCFEGLASGPAISQRWNEDPRTLPPDHRAWELEAKYISYAMHTTCMMFSPQRIILGGGVMEQYHLFTLIRERFLKSINAYIESNSILENIDEFIVPPKFGKLAGLMGGLALAMSGS